jgi:hypothetical protein
VYKLLKKKSFDKKLLKIDNNILDKVQIVLKILQE